MVAADLSFINARHCGVAGYSGEKRESAAAGMSPASLALHHPSWSAKADHPRVCLPQTACSGAISRSSHKVYGRKDVDARDKPRAWGGWGQSLAVPSPANHSTIWRRITHIGPEASKLVDGRPSPTMTGQGVRLAGCGRAAMG